MRPGAVPRADVFRPFGALIDWGILRIYFIRVILSGRTGYVAIRLLEESV